MWRDAVRKARAAAFGDKPQAQGWREGPFAARIAAIEAMALAQMTADQEANAVTAFAEAKVPLCLICSGDAVAAQPSTPLHNHGLWIWGVRALFCAN